MGLLKSNVRFLRSIAIAVLVLLAGAAIAMAVGSRDDAAARTGTWPIALEYELHYQEIPDVLQPLALANYSFQGESWSSWRNVQVSGPNEGYTMEVRPDGTVLAGYPDWPNLKVIDRQEPGHEAVPLADFAVVSQFLARVGASRDAVAEVAGVKTSIDTVDDVAQRLAIDQADLLGYEVATNDVSGNSIVTSYVVHIPTRIPLELTERSGNHETRKLIVESIDFLEGN